MPKKTNVLPQDTVGDSKNLNIFIIALITVELILKLLLTLSSKVSWDEFHYLSQVYEFLRGERISNIQMFHVHLFPWLTKVSDNEIIQIVAARLTLYILLFISCLLIYKIGRYFLSRTSSLFTVLCYLSLSNVMIHGASFRYDSLGSFLFLFSIYMLLAEGDYYKHKAILSGIAMALSFMLSIKASFQLLTLAVFLLCLAAVRKSRKEEIMKIAFFSVSFFVTLTFLYMYHTHSIPHQIQLVGGAGGDAGILNRIFKKVYSIEFWLSCLSCRDTLFYRILLGKSDHLFPVFNGDNF